MASDRWLSIKVELISGRDLVLEHPAGRLMIASPNHTLAELAEAIDLAFARWDHSHLHLFEGAGPRRGVRRSRPTNPYRSGLGLDPDQYGRIGEGE